MTGGRRNVLELGLRAQDQCVLPSVGRVGAGGRKTALLRVGDRLQRGQNGEEGMIREGSALMRTDPQVLAGGPSCGRRAWATLSKEGTPFSRQGCQPETVCSSDGSGQKPALRKSKQMYLRHRSK